MTSEMSTRSCTGEVKVKVKTNSISGMVAVKYFLFTYKHYNTKKYKKSLIKSEAVVKRWLHMILNDYSIHKLKVQVKVQGTNYGITFAT